jgi:hypothetical protein
MTIYDRAAATALRLLAKYGEDVTLRTYTTGTYDPATGTTPNTTADTTRKAATFDYPRLNQGQVLAGQTLIQQGDRQCLMDANGAAPTMADHVIVDSIEYVIKDIKTLSPAGTPVLYELQLRK